MAFQNQKPPIKCEKCGYACTYKGKLKRTTYPNCANKTRTLLETPLTSSTSQEDHTSKIIREYLES